MQEREVSPGRSSEKTSATDVAGVSLFEKYHKLLCDRFLHVSWSSL